MFAKSYDAQSRLHFPSLEARCYGFVTMPLPPAVQRRRRTVPPLWPLLCKAFSFPALLTLLLVCLVWILSLGKANDPDIWWHLRNAEYLVQTHQLPNHDLYSFTVAGKDWLNYEWLAEIPFYVAWRINGLAGVNILWMLLVQAIFLGL